MRSQSQISNQLVGLCNLVDMQSILLHLHDATNRLSNIKPIYSPSAIIMEEDNEYLVESGSNHMRSSGKKAIPTPDKTEHNTGRHNDDTHNDKINMHDKKVKKNHARKFEQSVSNQSPNHNNHNVNPSTAQKRKPKKFEQPINKNKASPYRRLKSPQNNNGDNNGNDNGNNHNQYIRIDDLLHQLTKTKQHDHQSHFDGHFPNNNNHSNNHSLSYSLMGLNKNSNAIKYQSDGYAGYTHYNTIDSLPPPKPFYQPSNFGTYSIRRNHDYNSTLRQPQPKFQPSSHHPNMSYSVGDNYSQCQSVLNPYKYPTHPVTPAPKRYGGIEDKSKNSVMYVPASRNRSENQFQQNNGYNTSRSVTNLRPANLGMLEHSHLRSPSASRSVSRSHSHSRSPVSAQQKGTRKNRHSFYQTPKKVSPDSNCVRNANNCSNYEQNMMGNTYHNNINKQSNNIGLHYQHPYVNSRNSMLSKFEKEILLQDDNVDNKQLSSKTHSHYDIPNINQQNSHKNNNHQSKITTEATTHHTRLLNNKSNSNRSNNNRQVTNSNTIINKLGNTSDHRDEYEQQLQDQIIDHTNNRMHYKNGPNHKLDTRVRQSLTYLSEARVPPKPIPIQIKK